MVFEFQRYKLDVNVEATRKYYGTAKSISENCTCDGCRNYEKAIDFLPHEVLSFFAQLGIEMKKASEVYIICANADDTLLYSGWYHLCAVMIHGESAWVSASQAHAYWDSTKTYPITNDFKVSFQEECALLDDTFPLPVIQLQIEADIPWVLAEKHYYPKDMSRRK